MPIIFHMLPQSAMELLWIMFNFIYNAETFLVCLEVAQKLGQICWASSTKNQPNVFLHFNRNNRGTKLATQLTKVAHGQKLETPPVWDRVGIEITGSQIFAVMSPDLPPLAFQLTYQVGIELGSGEFYPKYPNSLGI